MQDCYWLSDTEALVCLSALRKLEALKLDLSRCSGLQDNSAIYRFLAGLSQLRQLRLSFAECGRLDAAAVLVPPLKSLRQLQLLHLDLSGLQNEVILQGHSLGLGRELQRVAVHLTELRVDMSRCALRDASEILRGVGSLARLQRLQLSFSGCADLAGVAALGDLHRWNRNPRPQPHTSSKLSFLFQSFCSFFA